MIREQLDTWFEPTTMSLHIIEWQPIQAKQWIPGWWHMKWLPITLDHETLWWFISNVLELCTTTDQWIIEINKAYSKVVQRWLYRIVIVLPPLSDKREVTIVKAVQQRTLDQYSLDDWTKERLMSKWQWVLIAWAPWEGKTTFAQALLWELEKRDLIIKTIESPRDLQVSNAITQYSFSHGTHDEIRDILLLSRPDITVYDEVRNTNDFELFKDLRLTGIWLIGVMHATKAIDSVQRFIGTIDMWLIAQIIDTVVLIKNGDVQEVITLEQTVAPPSWMNAEDLARPIIYVKSFPEQKLLYEMYSYGESMVVMPIEENTQSTKKTQPISIYAQHYLEDILSDEFRENISVIVTSPTSITISIAPWKKWKIIGKNGERIQRIEKKLGLHITVKENDLF
jgi:ATPase